MLNFSKNLAGILYESAGEWLIVAILAHLRACDDVWSCSIYAMLVQDNPLLAAIHPRQWVKVTPYTVSILACRCRHSR